MFMASLLIYERKETTWFRLRYFNATPDAKNVMQHFS